jgi:DNA-binding response OmpR family regulator
LRKIAMISKPGQLRVFIGDEEFLFASCMALFLCEERVTARAFADPLEALFVARSAPPDILISDVALNLLAGLIWS